MHFNSYYSLCDYFCFILEDLSEMLLVYSTAYQSNCIPPNEVIPDTVFIQCYTLYTFPFLCTVLQPEILFLSCAPVF